MLKYYFCPTYETFQPKKVSSMFLHHKDTILLRDTKKGKGAMV